MKILIWSRWIDDIFLGIKSPDGIGGAEMQLAYWAYLLAKEDEFTVFSFGRSIRLQNRNIHGVNFLFYPWVRYVSTLWKFIRKIHYLIVKPDLVIIRDRRELEYFLKIRYQNTIIVFMLASDVGLNQENSLLIGHLNRVDKIIVQNSFQMSFLQKIKLDYKAKLLRSLFVPELFGQTKLLETEEFDYIFIGNLRKVKRPELYLKLARQLPQYKFALIGNISEVIYKDQINTLLLQRSKNLKYFGSLEMTDVISILKKSKVLVLTSLKEGYPNAYVQARHYGKGIVGTVNPNFDLKNSKGVYFVDDVNKLKEIALKALSDYNNGFVELPNNNNATTYQAFKKIITEEIA